MTAGRTVNSSSHDWCTPHKYVEAVKHVFGGGIDLDPCSNRFSVVHASTEYSLSQHDGLRESWDYRHIYVNPPYGADRDRGTTIKDWFRRCWEAHRDHESEVIALVPVATNTAHWKRWVWGAATAVCFLYDTRLRFLVQGRDEGKGAPMSCAMIYWGEFYDRFFDVFIKHGAVTDLRVLLGGQIGGYHKHAKETLPFPMPPKQLSLRPHSL